MDKKKKAGAHRLRKRRHMVIFDHTVFPFYSFLRRLLSSQNVSDSGSMDCEHGTEITFTPLKKILLIIIFTCLFVVC